MQTFLDNRQGLTLHHLVPLAFVASLLLPLVVSVFWPPALLALIPVLLLYLPALLLFSVIAWRRKRGRYVMLLPVVFVILHISYGLGSIQGFFQFAYRALKRR